MWDKTSLIELFIKEGVLLFGDYQLKSGRNSPYFFNLGQLCSGAAMVKLGDYYAQALLDADLAGFNLFGPAYKGIPLVTATAVALAHRSGETAPFFYNRKEAKDHGEGGVFVGSSGSKVVVIDDVISAGVTAHATIKQLADSGIDCVAWLVALDRQERSQDSEVVSSVWLAEETGVLVLSLLGLDDILEFVKRDGQFAGPWADKIKAYQSCYG